MGEKKNATGASAHTSRTPESRIASAAKRLRIDDLAIVEGQGDDGRAVRVRGTVGGYLGIDRLMQRAAPRQTTPVALVAEWLESRARNVLRGIETPEEAFADCWTVEARVGTVVPFAVTVEPSDRSIEQAIDTFRSALSRLQIPERDVKVTWDTASAWARFRAKLPSGRTIDKTVRNHTTAEGCLNALACWLRDRARGVTSGSEPSDLDEVFAGSLVKVTEPGKATT